VASIAPDLTTHLPARALTLTDLADDDERTRFYPLGRTYDLAYLVSRLVGSWVEHCHPSGVLIRLWDLPAADATDLELIEMLRRRNFLQGVEIVDAGATPIPSHTDPVQVVIDADGTCADPRLLAAYAGLDGSERAALHTSRAKHLIEQDQPTHAHGAIPYHLERGLQPRQALPWLLAAQNHAFREGFYGTALDYGRRCRRLLEGQNAPADDNIVMKRMIGALTYLGQCDEAIQLIQKHRRTASENSSQVHDAYMMAMIYARHHNRDRIDLDEAMAWINTALASADAEPDHQQRAFFQAFLLNARALIVLYRGDLHQALDLVNQAIEIASALGSTHALHRTVLQTNRGRVLAALGRPREALASFDEVLQLDPAYEDAYFERAVLHRTLEDPLTALADLDRAIALNEAFADAHYNRADILADLGDVQQATLALDTVLDINPGHLNGRINRAVLRIETGDLNGAADDLRIAGSIRPEDAGVWAAVGLLRTELGDHLDAEKAYDRALHLDPRLVAAWANRAVLRFTVGRVEEAISDLDRAIEIDDSPALRVNRGIGHHQVANYTGAITDYDHALTLGARNPGQIEPAAVIFHRALSRLELGDHDGAEDDFTTYLHAMLEAPDSALAELASQPDLPAHCSQMLTRISDRLRQSAEV
jgi:tetratricopeptide (TPR) repeat protein